MKKLTVSLLIAAAFAVSSHAASAQDIAAGKTSFNKCMACHSIGEGAKNKVGPELNGLDGRKSGTVEGYSYSDADQAKKKTGFVWNAANFDVYITNPQKDIPGTKMVFPGIPQASQRADLWAYLSSFKADGSKK